MKNMIAHFQLRLLIFIRRWTPVTLTLADTMLLMSIFFIYLFALRCKPSRYDVSFVPVFCLFFNVHV